MRAGKAKKVVFWRIFEANEARKKGRAGGGQSQRVIITGGNAVV